MWGEEERCIFHRKRRLTNTSTPPLGLGSVQNWTQKCFKVGSDWGPLGLGASRPGDVGVRALVSTHMYMLVIWLAKYRAVHMGMWAYVQVLGPLLSLMCMRA